MKKLTIILLIVLAVALFPIENNESAKSFKDPITTLDLPHIN